MNKTQKNVLNVFFVIWMIFSYSTAILVGLSATGGGYWTDNKAEFIYFEPKEVSLFLKLSYSFAFSAGLTVLNLLIAWRLADIGVTGGMKNEQAV